MKRPGFPSKIESLSDEEFLKILDNSYSYADFSKQVGLCSVGKNISIQIAKRCEQLNIPVPDFKAKRKNKPKDKTNKKNNEPLTLEEIFCENSTASNIKAIILKNKLLEYRCNKCGNTGEYFGKPLNLELNHINGNHFDNRLENLEFLCPNCHSQTSNFGGRNSEYKTS